MVALSLEAIVEAAQQLSPEEKTALIYVLQRDVAAHSVPLTRERIVAELAALREAGAFTSVESLAGKYVRPDIDVSDAELNAYLRDTGSEWEQDLDELSSN